ncbi:MAG TPA: SRPBCC family protein [Candidatus Dormibacteraeota bacterium]|nr:SRPBCC family protein [Candidatus Dormibacteraeota bacterium]
MSETFVQRSRIDASAEKLFEWHAQPGALERLTPPWEQIEILEPAPGIHDGSRGAFRVRVGTFRVRWEFEHRGYIEGRQFQDFQRSGPFRRWEHTHRFIPDGPAACWLEDRIEYEVPMGTLGSFLAGWFVKRKLRKLFAYRHRVTSEAFAARK